VIGAGIIGLAVARELLDRRPRSSLCVFERERCVGAHQTSHSSGVIHAGIYYQPGSLKARLCVRGARALQSYCAEHDVAVIRCGKLIVATCQHELPRLDELERRGAANGVASLRRLDAGEIPHVEPHARGIAALHSPDTAVVDFSAVARALAHDVRQTGGVIATGCGIESIAVGPRSLGFHHAQGSTEARHAIFCAGAWADRLAVAAGADPDPRIVPFRGAYLRLRPERRHLVRGLIYPVPDPALPFLGAHLTRHVDGEVTIGPTALLAAARDAYRLQTVRREDVLDALSWPGTWRMLGRHWRAAAIELRRSLRRAALVRAAASIVPALQTRDVEPAFAGVRAQALARDGRLLEDFVFSSTPRALHVRNAPSPAATAALAIAEHVAERAAREFGLAG
jgi:(S)-2-hydroxyglutarate dehydrogenase